MDRKRAHEIFEVSLALAPEERGAFVRAECANDAALEAEVGSLLGALERAGGFMVTPTMGPPPETTVGTEPASMDSLTGESIGPYKLLEPLGEGGFGTVYMAQQEVPIRRRVAVKVLKPGMDSKQVVARFEAERQALAMMDHPNIARVLDAGQTSAAQGSRPYFVMELVRGDPITRYCDQARLAPRERLALVISVCKAVQHAHQKGIIHRDIKPSNVLVTLHDGKPVPKVIDFGIAKATGQSLTDKTLFTEFRQLIGTPAYMSPEQAEMSGLDIDTRSDVYSLGVLLYELLTGGPPFETADLMKAGIGEMQRIIRESEPPRPSTRIATAGRLAMIAEQRQTNPERLGRLMRGELDWIVMRAMEKDRRRRYDTAIGLSEDLERYLSGQPVEAAPPSRAYRTTKFVRRNRVAVTAASVVAGTLVLGIVGTTWGFLQAAIDRDKAWQAEGEQERLRIIADQERAGAEQSAREARLAQRVEAAARASAITAAARAEAMLSFSDHMIGSANPDVTATAQTTTSQMLRSAADRAEEFFKGQPEAEFAVRVRIGRAYWAQRDPDAAIEQFRRADTIAQQLPGIGAFDRLQLYWPYLIVGSMMNSGYSNGPYQRIQIAARDLIEPEHPEAWRVIQSMRTTGLIWSQLDEARGHQIAQQIERVIREDLRVGTPAADAGIAMLNLWGMSSARRRRLGADPDGYSRLAIDCFDRTLGMLLETHPETNSYVARVRQRRVEVLYELKDYPRALAAAKEWEEAAGDVLPADHWMRRMIQGYEGVLLLHIGDANEALHRLEAAASGAESVDEIQELSGVFAEHAAEAQRTLGNAEEAAQWEAKAAAWYREQGAEPLTTEVLRRIFSPNQQPLVDVMIRTVELVEANSPEAGPAILSAIELGRQLCPPEDPAAGVWYTWGCSRIFAYESGRESPGVTLAIQRSLDEFLYEFGHRLPREWPANTGYIGYIAYHVGIARTLDADQHPDPKARLQSAEMCLRESIQRLGAIDPEAPYLQLVHSWLGRCLYLQGRHEDALEALGECEQAIAGESGAGSVYAAVALSRRLACLIALNRVEEARWLIELYMKLDQSLGMPMPHLRSNAQILLRGTGHTQEQLALARGMAQHAVEKEPASAANQVLLMQALRRTGSGDEARGIAERVLGHEAFVTLTPTEANLAVWTLVQYPGVEPSLAGKAADSLAAVVEKNPKSAAIVNTLAVAQYRAGRFQEAAELGRVRVKSFKRDGFTADPTAGDYAVLAMALFRLGRPEEARNAFSLMPRAIVDGPIDEDDAGLLAEARELIKVNRSH